jgi:hypothetical protein
MGRAKIDWGQTLPWMLLLGLGVGILSSITQNPKVNPKIRLIAQDAESQLMQDLESQALYLVKDGVWYLVG